MSLWAVSRVSCIPMLSGLVMFASMTFLIVFSTASMACAPRQLTECVQSPGGKRNAAALRTAVFPADFHAPFWKPHMVEPRNYLGDGCRDWCVCAAARNSL